MSAHGRRRLGLVFFACVGLLLPAEAWSQPATTPTANPAAGTAQPSPSPPGDMGGMEMTWPTATDESGGGMMMTHRQRPTTFVGRLVAWLGAWHPAVIHFPIALLLTVALLEIAAMLRRKPIYSASNKLLLGVATLGAFAAAPLGWADAGWPAVGDSLALTAHRWTGTILPLLFATLWLAKRPSDEAAVRPASRSYEFMLAVVVLIVLGQAYLGGEITHGANHMAF